MQTTGMVNWRIRRQEVRPGVWERRSSFFDAHPVGEIVRGIFFSSVLWGLLAVGVYTVYAMVLGTH